MVAMAGLTLNKVGTLRFLLVHCFGILDCAMFACTQCPTFEWPSTHASNLVCLS